MVIIQGECTVKPSTVVVFNWPSSTLMVSMVGFEVSATIIKPTACLISTKPKVVLKVMLRSVR